MLTALALSALLQTEPGGDLVMLALRYLARHQAEDGSWGARPSRCACPEEPAPRGIPPLDDPGRARVAALLAELDAEDPERRLSAQEGLVREGRAAEPLIRGAGGSPEARARADDVLRRIRRQGTREDVEVTAWALLAFMGAGYSHLSKDEHDGLVFGTTVGKGLGWLIKAKPASAVAALALSEAYGLTGSKLFEAPAQRAIDGLVADLAKDDRHLAWQVMALKSAEIGGLSFPRSAYDDRLSELQRRRSASSGVFFLQAADVMSRIFVHRSKENLDVGGLPTMDPSKVDVETAYLASLALFQYDGPGGPVWKAYREADKKWIVPLQITARGECARGAWPAAGTAARLRFGAFGALMNEIYYAYSIQK